WPASAQETNRSYGCGRSQAVPTARGVTRWAQRSIRRASRRLIALAQSAAARRSGRSPPSHRRAVRDLPCGAARHHAYNIPHNNGGLCMVREDHPAAADDGRPAGWPGEPVYLDYNATTPVDARVAEAARPYWEQWFGNPSSGHAYAERPRQAVA